MKKIIVALSLVFAVSAASAQKKAESKTDDENAEMAVQLIEKLMGIVADNKDDCKKMATELNKFIGDNKAKFAEVKELGKNMTEEKKAAMKKKYEPRFKAAFDKAQPGFMACKDSAEVKAAMEGIPR